MQIFAANPLRAPPPPLSAPCGCVIFDAAVRRWAGGGTLSSNQVDEFGQPMPAGPSAS